MNKDKDFLGTEPVGKLMFRLALPTITAQLMTGSSFGEVMRRSNVVIVSAPMWSLRDT